jgi:hypothetical protein
MKVLFMSIISLIPLQKRNDFFLTPWHNFSINQRPGDALPATHSQQSIARRLVSAHGLK